VSEEKKSIFELLPQVQRLIGGIGKDNVNTHQRYNFRGIDDVLNAIGPALAKVGVTVTAQVVDYHREEVERVDARGNKGYRVNVWLKLRVTFWGPDGSKLSNCTIGEAQDFNGDKATNKAMSVAFKYAAFMGLAIPVDPGVMDDSDHDDRVPDSSPQKSPQQKAAETRARNKAAGGNTPVGKPGKHSAKGGERPAGAKEPPNAMDGKPATSKQVSEIIDMIKVITGQPATGEDFQAKVRGLLGHFNGRRETEDDVKPAAGLEDLFYFEGENAIKILQRQMPK
jgi:hypothetical protein